MKGQSNVIVHEDVTAEDYPRLVTIWRSAVDATHGFVDPGDLAEIEGHLAAQYLPAVRLHVAHLDGELVGFAGTSQGVLEMVFVDARYRGRGVGRALLDHAIREAGVNSVDVNEQNEQAVGFYERFGFRTVGRSEFDEAGRPYPLLHMKLDEPVRPDEA